MKKKKQVKNFDNMNMYKKNELRNRINSDLFR